MKKPDQSDLICQLRLELSALEEQMGAMSRGALKAQERIERLGSENYELKRRVDHLRWKLHHRNLNHDGDFDECRICPVRVTIHTDTPLQNGVVYTWSSFSSPLHPAAVR